MDDGQAALHAVHGQQGEYGEILLVNHDGMMDLYSDYLILITQDIGGV